MQLCGFEVGIDKPLFLIAGPCVIESQQMAIDTAGQLKEIAAAVGIPFIYKSSYDKANRSSNKTFRGFGITEGLKILDEVRRQIGVPILTDVHTEEQVAEVASVVDVLQTPAFLCRQTDFITAVATCGGQHQKRSVLSAWRYAPSGAKSQRSQRRCGHHYGLRARCFIRLQHFSI